MSDDLHAQTARRVATSGRTAIGIPKTISKSAKRRKKWIFTDKQQMEPPHFMVPKVADTLRCSDKDADHIQTSPAFVLCLTFTRA